MRKGPHRLQGTPGIYRALQETRLLGPLGGRAELGEGECHLGLLLPPAYTCGVWAVMGVGDNDHEFEVGNIPGWCIVITCG